MAHHTVSSVWWYRLLSCPCKGWAVTPAQSMRLIKIIPFSLGLLLRVKQLRVLKRESSVITANWAVYNNQHAALYNSKHSQRTTIVCSSSQATFSAQQLEHLHPGSSEAHLLPPAEKYKTKWWVKTEDPPQFLVEYMRFGLASTNIVLKIPNGFKRFSLNNSGKKVTGVWQEKVLLWAVGHYSNWVLKSKSSVAAVSCWPRQPGSTLLIYTQTSKTSQQSSTFILLTKCKQFKLWVVQHLHCGTFKQKQMSVEPAETRTTTAYSYSCFVTNRVFSFRHSFTSSLAAQNATHSGKEFGNVFGWSTPQTEENTFCASYFTPTLAPPWLEDSAVLDNRFTPFKMGTFTQSLLSQRQERTQPQTGLQHLLDIFFPSIWSWQSQQECNLSCKAFKGHFTPVTGLRRL